MAIGLIQRAQQCGVKAPGQACAWQASNVAQRSAADVGERHPVGTQGTEHGQRQRIQQRSQRLPQTVLDPGTGQCQRSQCVRCPGQSGGPKFLRPGPQPLAQRQPSTEQAQAAPHLQQHGFFGDGDAGRELQRPDRQRLPHRVSGRKRFVGTGQLQRGPQHGRPHGKRQQRDGVHRPAGKARPAASRPAGRTRQAHAPGVAPCA